jgi:hypothetical protein
LGVNYIDLADARDFVARVPSLDDAAKRSGVCVISGASTTPALSHAVLDVLTKDWRSVYGMFVGISPGNRAPRGLSVVQAILSSVGKPLVTFEDGCWREVAGWTGNERRRLDGLGSRSFVHCETPDQDLLVERYRPRATAHFKAGLELGVMHHALRVLAWLVHKGVPLPLQDFAPAFQRLASWLKPFGTDRGGMLVEVRGTDDAGKARSVQWSLCARGGTGPSIPVLPALALLLRRGSLAPGARAAAGEVLLSEILPHLARLGIDIKTRDVPLVGPDAFQRAVGEKVWQALPEVTRCVHQCQPGVVLKGKAKVTGAKPGVAGLVARAFGFPKSADEVEVTVNIAGDGVRETWRRRFGGHLMRSVMVVAEKHPGCVEECFGPFRFRMRLDCGRHGLDMVPEGLRVFGVKLPLFLLPDIVARERVSEDGKHLFHVRISKWPLGLLVEYRGWLKAT